MKKILFTLCLSVIATFFLCCNLVTVQDQELTDAPGIYETNGTIALTVYRYSSDTKYINIYRKDVSSPDDEPILQNLGILFPEAYSNKDKSYVFADELFYTGHKYQYMVRYAVNNKYYYSDWSEIITATSGLDSSIKLTYQTNNVNFRYSDSDLTLKFVGTIVDPDIPNFATEWNPALIVKTENLTQAFTLEDTANGSFINLRGLLSSEFYDVDIIILGIIGQKEIYTTPTDGSDAVLKQIIWTAPSNIDISGYSKNILNIHSETGSSGYDFS